MSSTAIVPIRAIDIVRSEAWQHGLGELTEDAAGHILFNFTGFPSFWPAGFARPLDAIRWQVHLYCELALQGFQPCAACGERALDWLCPHCEADFLDFAEDTPPLPRAEVGTVTVEVTGERL